MWSFAIHMFETMATSWLHCWGQGIYEGTVRLICTDPWKVLVCCAACHEHMEVDFWLNPLEERTNDGSVTRPEHFCVGEVADKDLMPGWHKTK